MLYNKNNVRKTNDKKILHKVGKQWKVISVALLMAIGGGAVATHVANAQSNNTNNNSALEVNEASAEAAPATVPAVSAAPSSATSSSANSAKPSSAVSYVTKNGQLTHGAKAASYSAEAVNDASTVSAYVNSLNAKFPVQAKFANSTTASAQAAAKSDKALANSYSAVANDKGAQSAVSSLASKAGYTVNDYANYIVKPLATNYNNGLKSASALANAASLASSLVEDAMFNEGSLSDAANEAKTNAMNASVNAKIAGIQNNVNTSASNNVTAAIAKNNKALNDAPIASAYASADAREQMAEANVLTSASTSNVVAKYANNNSAAVFSAVNSYATAKNYAKHYTNLNAYSLAGVNSLTNAANSSAYSAMNKLVSNAYALNSDAAVTAKENSVIASANAAKASLANESASYTAAYNKASNALKGVNAASDAANSANAALSTVAKGMNANSASFISGLVNAAGNGRSALESFLNVPGVDKSSLLVKADLASMASAEGINVNTIKSNAAALKVLAQNAKVAANGNYSKSNLASVENSMVSSANSALTSASSAASSFASSTDENETLASYYASSYNSNASSEANVASSAASVFADYAAKNGVNNAAYKAALADQPNAIALAKAYAQGAYNNAPKYVTVEKQVALYNVANGKYSWVVNVPAGTRLTVNAVSIAKNGQLRYVTSYKGKKGTVNSYMSYVTPTYLTDQSGVDVKVVKNSKIYKTMDFSTSYTGKSYNAGKVLKNVNIVSPAHGVYGGFTAVQLSNGEFVSANVAYAEVENNNSNNNSSVTPASQASTYYFD